MREKDMIRRLLVLLALALVPSLASAQGFIHYYPPSSGSGTWDGGTFSAAAEGPTGCAAPAFSFTDDTNAGLCLSAANASTWQTAASGNTRTYLSIGTLGFGANYINGSGVISAYSLLENSHTFNLAGETFAVLSSTGLQIGGASSDDLFKIDPPTDGAGQFTGTATSADLTDNRTWTFPDATGDVAVTAAAGFPARTAAQTWAARTITAATGGAVTNGDGVSGNPTVGPDLATTNQYVTGTGSPPATCTAGRDIYVETDVPRACNCSNTNVWTCSSQVRTHATDCTALTDGLTNDICLELDSERLFSCQPTAGGCDTAGEWIAQTIAAAQITGDVAFSQIAQASAASKLLGRGSAGGAGDFEEITLGTNLSMSGTTLNVSGGSGEMTRPNTKRWMLCEQGSSGSSGFQCHGMSTEYVVGGNAVIDPDGTDGVMGQVVTTASTDDSSVMGTNNDSFRAGYSLRIQMYSKVNQTTSQRVFLGLNSGNNAVAATPAADPTLHIAAFRYDTGASDTNWQCVTNDNAGGGTINDSGITANTTSHEFEIIDNGSSFTFYIDGALVCTNSTNLPTGNMYLYTVIRTLTTAAKQLQTGWIYAESNK